MNDLLTITDEFAQMKTANRSAVAAIRNALMYGKRAIWADPSKAQGQVDKFGTNAARLFRGSALSVQLYYEATGVLLEIMPRGWGYTPNPDGTVTIVPPSPPAPSAEQE